MLRERERMGIELDQKKNETKLKRERVGVYIVGDGGRGNNNVVEETAKQITKTGKTRM